MGKKVIRKKKKRPLRTGAESVPLSSLKGIVSQIKAGQSVSSDDLDKLDAAIDTLAVVTGELEQSRVSVARLKRLLFGDTTEKLSNVFPELTVEAASVETEAPSSVETTADDSATSGARAAQSDEAVEKPKARGHGRNGAISYKGAQKQLHRHSELVHKGPCPEEGCDGRLYLQKEPARLIRVTGMAPLVATVHELERLRCNLCGRVFTANGPEGVGDETYDNRARAMIALLKYGCGMPFHRLERLEKDLGIPLPSSTQWDEVHRLAMAAAPVYTEMIAQAANGTVLHNDDTTARILELESPPKVGKNGKERTGVYTSGILSVKGNREIALFFTGREHAGENLAKVLAQRHADLATPIQMCDALSANTTGDFNALLAGCNCHARRKFVEVADAFPAETRHVLEVFRNLYRHDDATKGMTDADRMAYHVERSKPLLDALKSWFHQQVEVERNIEPNSVLGAAIDYMETHWDALTLFLKVPGAPLDNNVCERAIKKAILHRKNALFFKTENGARVADLFMSLIHTCELQDINPFDYLTALADNAVAAAEDSEAWLPWNWHARIHS